MYCWERGGKDEGRKREGGGMREEKWRRKDAKLGRRRLGGGKEEGKERR